MRILLIGSHSESLLNYRGPLLADIAGLGHEVHVAAPSLLKHTESYSAIVSLRYVPHNVFMRRASFNPFSDILSFISLYFLCRNIRPNLVLTYTLKPAIYGTLASTLAFVPRRFALISGLGYAFTGESRGLRSVANVVVRYLLQISIRFNHKIFFQNPDDRNLFCDLNIIQNITKTALLNGSGVDTVKFNLSPMPPGPPIFLLVARLLGDKGIREYAEAARIIRTKDNRVRFKLVGWIDENPDAIDSAELEEWITSGSLEYLGRLKDVRPAISSCSVFVLPSYREGTPLSVLEAMAMGRAIITTDTPGCRETVVDGINGYLVPTKSVDALIEKMMFFVDNPSLSVSMGAASRQIALNKFEVKKVNSSMLKEMDLI
jgi:glycosyltransferase involved in cell wall biosynthesis